MCMNSAKLGCTCDEENLSPEEVCPIHKTPWLVTLDGKKRACQEPGCIHGHGEIEIDISDLFMRKMWAVCDDRTHLISALNKMTNIPVVIRNVEGREGYRCGCGDKAMFYIGETSRRS